MLCLLLPTMYVHLVNVSVVAIEAFSYRPSLYISYMRAFLAGSHFPSSCSTLLRTLSSSVFLFAPAAATHRE